MDVFDLMAKLSIDSSEYDKGLSDASDGASKFGKGLKTAFKVGGAAIAATATAITGVTTALVKGAGDVASYGDDIDKMSQKLGLSAEAYQEWDAVMQHSGSSVDSLKGGIKTLNKSLADAMEVINSTAEAESELEEKLESGEISFEEYDKQYDALYEGAYSSIGTLSDLGFSMMEMEQMANDSDLALKNIIMKLQEMPEGAERSAIATELLGRSAMELGPLLNTSAEETQEMMDRVHELGGVMSDDAVKAAAHYQDSLQDMQTAFSGLQRNLMGEFLPSITTVMDGLTELFAGRGGLDLISEGVKSFVDTLSASIPQIMETGSGIILALVEAIVENLPTLLDAAVQAIMTIATGLIEQLPTIVKAGFDILLSIVQGIVDNLPELIPAAIDVILEIIDTLTDPTNLGMLIDAAIAIILALTNGIIDAIPRLIERAPEIIENLVTALVENAPKLLKASLEIIVSLVKGIFENLPQIFEAGGKIVAEIIAGIGQAISGLWDAGKEAIQSVKDGFDNLNPLEWGKDLISNFVGGITSKWEDLKSSVKGVAQTVKDLLGFSEPKEGPLSDFHTYAPDMMELFAKGIRDNERLITDQIEKSFDFGDMTIGAVGSIETAPIESSYQNSRMAMPENAFSSESLAEAIKAALSGAGVYMDGRKVGQLVTDFQSSRARVMGV